MASGSELDFKKDLQKKNVGLESPMSRTEIGREARKQTKAYQTYGEKQTKSGQKIISADKIAKLGSEKIGKINRETGAHFTE